MKKVYVTLKTKGDVYWMENLTEVPTDLDMIDLSMELYELEDEGWLCGDLYEVPLGLEDVEVYVGDDPNEEGEDITKKKGKYLKTKEYFSKVLGLKAPFYVRCINIGCEVTGVYEIELQDDEEFDPKKLQLLKSDYELLFIPYGIIMDYVYYDGKKIVNEVDTEYRDKGYWDAEIYNQ